MVSAAIFGRWRRRGAAAPTGPGSYFGARYFGRRYFGKRFFG